MYEEIVEFITKFQNGEEVKRLFSNGQCYWFSTILNERFRGDIMYLPVSNHFVFRPFRRVSLFDIEGDVTDLYSDEPIYRWEEYPYFDELDAGRVYNNCVLLREDY